MECYACHQPLSAAERMVYEERQREFEAFERACWECADQEFGPETLDDIEIPDGVPMDVAGLTESPGDLPIPVAWMMPYCDRCTMRDWIETVLYEWDGSYAYHVMLAYAEGLQGSPQSNLMAYSWALVLKRWYEGDGDASEDPYCIAMWDLLARLDPLLTGDEAQQARALAEDVFAIARAHGAIWV